jgi:hypothetical protein
MRFNIWSGFRRRAEAEFDDTRLVGISKQPNISPCASCARAAHGATGFPVLHAHGIHLTCVHQLTIRYFPLDRFFGVSRLPYGIDHLADCINHDLWLIKRDHVSTLFGKAVRAARREPRQILLKF